MEQKVTNDIEHMRDGLNKFCKNRILCEKNQKDGKTCIFYKYCVSHKDFETKDIESLYERMKADKEDGS